ncbi:UNVERIFIED_CONTAM: hypothetical protein GTU68_064733 [Idotea baltica]|nr:hypothetical protein [Idotea baltica]
MRQDSADEGDHSGDESDDEEGSKVTMSEFFGNKPNIETERNHPPNFKTDSPVLDLCFHPESELLAVAGIDGDSVLYRYSLEKVEEVSRFSHHKKSCRQICFNADGKILYTVSKDKSLAVVDAESAAVKLHFKDAHESPIYSFCEVDENVCCTGDDDGMVKLWDVRKPEAVFSEKCGEQTISSLMSCRAKKFLSATVTDGSITGFNLRKRRIEAQSEMFDSEFTCQSLVRSETRMVVGSGSGILYIFKWGDFGYNVDALSGHPDLIQCQAAISDKLIITGCEDGNIR